MRLPPIAYTSEEADVYPRNYPERADDIDFAIGDGFSNPNTEGTTGFCLDVYDLVLSKYAAGREKDMAFNRALVRYGCVAKAAPNNYRIDRVSGDSSVIARSPCDEAIQGPQHARRQQSRRSYCGPWIASLRSQ